MAKLFLYTVNPKVPYEERGFASFAGLPFFVMYEKRGGRLSVNLATMLSRQSLLRFIGVKESEGVHTDYAFWARLLYRKKHAFFQPVEVLDMQSFLSLLPEGTALALWAAPEPRLISSHVYHLDKIQTRRAAHYARNAQLIREKIKNTPVLVDLRLLSLDYEKLKTAEDALLDRLVVHGFSFPLAFKEARVKTPELLKFLSTPPSSSFWKMVFGKKPFNLTLDGLERLAPVPDPSVLPIEPSRGLPLPDLPPHRPNGFRIGETATGREVRIDEGDLERHCYIIGATGSGKTNALRLIARKLIERNAGAVVVLDPHGELADTIAAFFGERALYFHPTLSPFSVNPLKLPKLSSSDQARLLALSNLMEMFTKVFWLGENAVFVKYILQNAMNALYEKTDEPTFSDVYHTILALRDGTLQLSGSDWDAKLKFLQSIQQTSFVSALSRLELLATNKVLRRVFSGQTVDDSVFLERGRIVCINAGLSEVGAEASYLIMAGFLMKLWYLVTARYGSKEKTPVFVIIDEFQRIADLSQVDVMLSEARKYGLHLILAHQHTGQLGEGILKSVFSNTSMKMVFRINGDDVNRLKSIDPDFEQALGTVLSYLPKGACVLFCQPRSIAESFSPVMVQVDHEREVEEAELRLIPKRTEEADVKDFFASARFSPLEQAILYEAFENGEVELIAVGVKKGVKRGELERAAKKLAAAGFVTLSKKGKKLFVKYEGGLFLGLEVVAPSEEGREIAKAAMLHYLSQGYWVFPVTTAAPAGGAPDLIAVRGDPVAVEIESSNEVETHPEQVAANMVKPSTKRFKEVHVWTSQEKLERVRQILESLDAQEKSKVRLFSPSSAPPPEPIPLKKVLLKFGHKVYAVPSEEVTPEVYEMRSRAKVVKEDGKLVLRCDGREVRLTILSEGE